MSLSISRPICPTISQPTAPTISSPAPQPIGFPTAIAASVLETVLTRLAPLLLPGAAGDLAAARQAAAQMLAAHDAQTDDEIRLAGKLVGLSFQCLEALSQAAAEDLPLTAKLRLRGSAVSLSRESHRAQRQLDKLQRARREGRTEQPADAPPQTVSQPQPTEPQPAAVPAAQPAPIAATSVAATSVAATSVAATSVAAAPPHSRPDAIRPAGKTGNPTWTQSLDKRLAAQRITDQLKQNQAAHAARLAQQNAAAATQAATAAPTA